MKMNLRKQKKRIILKISLVMLCSWLVISTVFSIIVIELNKNKLINNIMSESGYLTQNISSNNFPSQLFFFEGYKTSDAYKHAPIFGTMEYGPVFGMQSDSQPPAYNRDIQIIVGHIGDKYTQLVNTDEDIIVQYEAVEGNTGKVFLEPARLNFDSFITSLGDKNHNTIKEYLAKKSDSEGHFYVLLCTEFYYDKEGFSVIPKRVELMLSSDKSTWYSDDELICSYDLSPGNLPDGAKLYKSGVDQRNVIPKGFVLDEFSSGGLIPDPETTLPEDAVSSAYGESYVERQGLFTYTVHQTHTGPFYKDYTDEVLSNTEIRIYQSNSIAMFFAHRINVLEYSYPVLLFGIAVIMLFFLTVGAILAIMMLRVIKTQAQEEQKRTELTNALAHDIKTPLFIIEGYAQSLIDNVNTNKREHYAQRIIERTKQANDLVHRMLSYSQLESSDITLNIETVDVHKLIKEVSEEFGELCDNPRFTITCDGECFIEADRELMKRALLNLMDNALRYSDEDTAICIETGKCNMSISNTCSSLKPDDIKHITEPCYKGDKSRNQAGSGLGLSIVKSILDMHSFGLDISLKNNVITFTITF